MAPVVVNRLRSRALGPGVFSVSSSPPAAGLASGAPRSCQLPLLSARRHESSTAKKPLKKSDTQTDASLQMPLLTSAVFARQPARMRWHAPRVLWRDPPAPPPANEGRRPGREARGSGEAELAASSPVRPPSSARSQASLSSAGSSGPVYGASLGQATGAWRREGRRSRDLEVLHDEEGERQEARKNREKSWDSTPAARRGDRSGGREPEKNVRSVTSSLCREAARHASTGDTSLFLTTLSAAAQSAERPIEVSQTLHVLASAFSSKKGKRACVSSFSSVPLGPRDPSVAAESGCTAGRAREEGSTKEGELPGEVAGILRLLTQKATQRLDLMEPKSVCIVASSFTLLRRYPPPDLAAGLLRSFSSFLPFSANGHDLTCVASFLATFPLQICETIDTVNAAQASLLSLSPAPSPGPSPAPSPAPSAVSTFAAPPASAATSLASPPHCLSSLPSVLPPYPALWAQLLRRLPHELASLSSIAVAGILHASASLSLRLSASSSAPLVPEEEAGGLAAPPWPALLEPQRFLHRAIVLRLAEPPSSARASPPRPAAAPEDAPPASLSPLAPHWGILQAQDCVLSLHGIEGSPRDPRHRARGDRQTRDAAVNSCAPAVAACGSEASAVCSGCPPSASRPAAVQWLSRLLGLVQEQLLRRLPQILGTAKPKQISNIAHDLQCLGLLAPRHAAASAPPFVPSSPSSSPSSTSALCFASPASAYSSSALPAWLYAPPPASGLTLLDQLLDAATAHLADFSCRDFAVFLSAVSRETDALRSAQELHFLRAKERLSASDAAASARTVAGAGGSLQGESEPEHAALASSLTLSLRRLDGSGVLGTALLAVLPRATGKDLRALLSALPRIWGFRDRHLALQLKLASASPATALPAPALAQEGLAGDLPRSAGRQGLAPARERKSSWLTRGTGGDPLRTGAFAGDALSSRQRKQEQAILYSLLQNLHAGRRVQDLEPKELAALALDVARLRPFAAETRGATAVDDKQSLVEETLVAICAALKDRLVVFHGLRLPAAEGANRVGGNSANGGELAACPSERESLLRELRESEITGRKGPCLGAQAMTALLAALMQASPSPSQALRLEHQAPSLLLREDKGLAALFPLLSRDLLVSLRPRWSSKASKGTLSGDTPHCIEARASSDALAAYAACLLRRDAKREEARECAYAHEFPEAPRRTLLSHCPSLSAASSSCASLVLSPEDVAEAEPPADPQVGPIALSTACWALTQLRPASVRPTGGMGFFKDSVATPSPSGDVSRVELEVEGLGPSGKVGQELVYGEAAHSSSSRRPLDASSALLSWECPLPIPSSFASSPWLSSPPAVSSVPGSPSCLFSSVPSRASSSSSLLAWILLRSLQQLPAFEAQDILALFEGLSALGPPPSCSPSESVVRSPPAAVESSSWFSELRGSPPRAPLQEERRGADARGGNAREETSLRSQLSLGALPREALQGALAASLLHCTADRLSLLGKEASEQKRGKKMQRGKGASAGLLQIVAFQDKGTQALSKQTRRSATELEEEAGSLPAPGDSAGGKIAVALRSKALRPEDGELATTWTPGQVALLLSCFSHFAASPAVPFSPPESLFVPLMLHVLLLLPSYSLPDLLRALSSLTRYPPCFRAALEVAGAHLGDSSTRSLAGAFSDEALFASSSQDGAFPSSGAEGDVSKLEGLLNELWRYVRWKLPRTALPASQLVELSAAFLFLEKQLERERRALWGGRRDREEADEGADAGRDGARTRPAPPQQQGLSPSAWRKFARLGDAIHDRFSVLRVGAGEASDRHGRAGEKAKFERGGVAREGAATTRAGQSRAIEEERRCGRERSEDDARPERREARAFPRQDGQAARTQGEDDMRGLDKAKSKEREEVCRRTESEEDSVELWCRILHIWGQAGCRDMPFLSFAASRLRRGLLHSELERENARERDARRAETAEKAVRDGGRGRSESAPLGTRFDMLSDAAFGLVRLGCTTTDAHPQLKAVANDILGEIFGQISSVSKGTGPLAHAESLAAENSVAAADISPSVGLPCSPVSSSGALEVSQANSPASPAGSPFFSPLRESSSPSPLSFSSSPLASVSFDRLLRLLATFVLWQPATQLDGRRVAAAYLSAFHRSPEVFRILAEAQRAWSPAAGARKERRRGRARGDRSSGSERLSSGDSRQQRAANLLKLFASRCVFELDLSAEAILAHGRRAVGEGGGGGEVLDVYAQLLRALDPSLCAAKRHQQPRRPSPAWEVSGASEREAGSSPAAAPGGEAAQGVAGRRGASAGTSPGETAEGDAQDATRELACRMKELDALRHRLRHRAVSAARAPAGRVREAAADLAQGDEDSEPSSHGLRQAAQQELRSPEAETPEWLFAVDSVSAAARRIDSEGDERRGEAHCRGAQTRSLSEKGNAQGKASPFFEAGCREDTEAGAGAIERTDAPSSPFAFDERAAVFDDSASDDEEALTLSSLSQEFALSSLAEARSGDLLRCLGSRKSIYGLRRPQVHSSKESSPFASESPLPASAVSTLTETERDVLKHLRLLSSHLHASSERLRLQTAVYAAPYTVPVIDATHRIAFEVGGPDHFFRDPEGTEVEITAWTSLRHRVLRAQGYRVVAIPHFEWTALPDRLARLHYLRRQLLRALFPKEASTYSFGASPSSEARTGLRDAESLTASPAWDLFVQGDGGPDGGRAAAAGASFAAERDEAASRGDGQAGGTGARTARDRRKGTELQGALEDARENLFAKIGGKRVEKREDRRY